MTKDEPTSAIDGLAQIARTVLPENASFYVVVVQGKNHWCVGDCDRITGAHHLASIADELYTRGQKSCAP